MEFSTGRSYSYGAPTSYLGEFKPPPEIEGQITVKDMGMSVTEGSRFGTFIQTTQNAIKLGAGKIELSSGAGGGQESIGAEAYGKDARQALREISRAANVDFVSVHTPAQLVGNLSGYNPQERGFSDEHRKGALEEVKRAIDFAADVNAGAVVVHTGEYQRDVSDQPWAKNPDGTFNFRSYDEEPGRATLYMVDDRTGKLITEVKKSMVVQEPLFKHKVINGRDRWIDQDGNPLDETRTDDLFKRVPEWDDAAKSFKTKRLAWQDFMERADMWNKYHAREDRRKWTPEEMFLRSQMETRILQSKGSSLFHGREYDKDEHDREELKKMLDYFKRIENEVPVEDQWKIYEQQSKLKSNHGRNDFTYRAAGRVNKLPSELIKESLESVELNMRFIHESSASADAQAKETEETMRHVVPVSVYAKEQSRRSFAEMGIYAMDKTISVPHAKKDVFVAPENIFPEFGYGSHPEELIELVTDARKEMVKMLTERKINDPSKIRDRYTGDERQVDNPYYRPGISKNEAEREATAHIRATLDTQHLGMWWKHFEGHPGEPLDDKKKRFDKWYLDQVKKLEEHDIIGHIHVVDAMGSGHQHLPVGQGVWPVRQALEYLKKKGYGGTMISEAYGEDSMHGPGRQLTEAWRGVGVPIRNVGYGLGAPGRAWNDVRNSYFGVTQNPYFIFGAYSPSNDWQLWSQIPME